MKLYWSPRSPFVRKVMVCAHELAISDRIEKVYTLVSSSKVNADMLRVNPLGRIPALVTEDNTVLYDSVVICEYLDSRYGGRLFPRDEKQRWNSLRRHALANGMLELLVLWRSELSRPESQQSPETLRAFERKVASALSAAATEEALDTVEVDIAHVTLGVVLGYLDFRYADIDWRARHPRLARWYGSFSARLSMTNTLPEDEQIRGNDSKSK
ncbi:MAG: glutathione S-transferase family protein [Burkholderiales bacterium]